MKITRMIFLWIIGFLTVSIPSALAEPTISDITLGKLLMGDEITSDDLKEHVVAIEFTGHH